MRRGTAHRGTTAAVVLVTVLAACTADGSSGGGSDGTDGADAAAAPLRYGLEFDVNLSDTFDPAASLSACDRVVLDFLYETLTELGEDGTPRPRLAESWEVGDDGRSLTLTLREGLAFSDGTAMDAAAVKAGLEHLKTGEQTASNLQDVTTIEVVDPRTVRLVLEEPVASTLPYVLSRREGMIVSPAAIAAGTLGDQPVGAGPFTLRSFRPGASILLERNEHYAGPTATQLEALEFVQVGVGVPAVNALRAGEVDVISFEAESLSVIESEQRFGQDSRTGEQYLQLQFRLDEPFDDVRVRQAVNHAIDREQINEVVLAGRGEVAWMPYPSAALGYDPDLVGRYPYDPDRARKLLAEAGHGDGLSITVVIPGGGIVNMERQGEIIQQQLAEVGITVELVRSTDIAIEYYLQKTGDAFSAARLPGAEPAGQLHDQWGAFQFVAIHNFAERADISELVEKSRTTTDAAQAEAFIEEAVAIVVDEALEVPIAFQPRNIAWSTERVGGSLRAPAGACDPIGIADAVMVAGAR